MEICNGAEWTTEQGNKRLHSETLSDRDGIALKGKDAWEQMSWVEQRAFLDRTADLLVLTYVYQNDGMSKDAYDTRVAAVKAR